jgi:hypothetical protein
MLDSLYFFGFRFTRAGNKYLYDGKYPDGVKKIQLTVAPFSSSQKSLKIERFLLKTQDGVIVSFRCNNHIRFAYDRHVNAHTPVHSNALNQVGFQIRGVQGQKSFQGIYLDVGPFGVRTQKAKLHVEKNEQGIRDFWIEVPNACALLDENDLPIALSVNQSSKMRIFLSMDTKVPQLQWKNNPFTLVTRLGSEADVTNKYWVTPFYAIDLDKIKKTQSIKTLERLDTAGEPLLLHPFLHNHDEKNYTLAAMGLDARSLILDITRSKNQNFPLQIDSIVATRENAGLLHTYGLVDYSQTRYHTWQGASEFSLAVRPSQGDKGPAGLLIKGGPGDSHLALIRNGGDTLLGFRKDVKLTLMPGEIKLGFSEYSEGGLHSKQINKAITFIDTTPFIDVPLNHLQLNRPGISLAESFSGEKPADIDFWEFSSEPGESIRTKIPLCPDECVLSDKVLKSLHSDCNRPLANLQAKVNDVVHESRFKQKSLDNHKSISLPSLFLSERTFPKLVTSEIKRNVVPRGSLSSPGLGAHISQYNFGSYVITKQWSESKAPDYVLFDDENSSNLVGSTGFRGLSINPFDMDNNTKPEQRARVSTITRGNGIAASGGRKIFAILKLGKTQGLKSILLAEGVSEKTWTELEKILPPRFLHISWYGFILFNQALDLTNFKLLGSLVPKGSIALQYLAVTPEVSVELDSSVNLEAKNSTFATYGYVSWKNKSKPDDLVHPKDRDEEVAVRMLQLDMAWAGRKLSRFYSETLVSIRTFAGSGTKKSTHTDLSKVEYNDVIVYGGYDKDIQKITFMAQASEPVALLSDEGIGPIKQAWVKRIEIGLEGKKTIFDIDGDVELQNFNQSMEPKNWQLEGGDIFSFKGLSFGFENTLSELGNWLKFDYPSIDFKLGKGWKLFDFDGCKVELKRIAFDKSGSDFDWGSLLEIGKSGLSKLPQFRLGLNIQMGKLPLLSTNPFEELIIDIEWSLPFKNSSFFKLDFSNARFGIRALGFEKLNLKLMRFLEISADQISIENKPSQTVQDILWLFIKDLKVKILDTTVLEKLTFGHYWIKEDNNGAGQKGFLGVSEQGFETGILNVHWALVGRNIQIPEDLAKSLISIVPVERHISEELWQSYKDDKLLPLNEPGIGEWIFAAGFGILDDFLLGKFLFQDNAYYGLALEGPMMKQVFGYRFAMSVLYIQKSRPEEDLFRLEVAVPNVDLGGFSFNGGVIAIEIQMNGGFLIDMGYPWIAPNGERMWERGFGIMLSGLMGRGGCFIAKRSSVRTLTKDKGTDKQNVLTLFEGGQAAMVGFGGSYSAGPLHVTAYAGIYYAAEGAILFQASRKLENLTVIGLRLSGAIGIQARGIAELDWWIISVRVEVVAGAEARLTIFWGALEHYQPGSPDLPDLPVNSEKVGVRVDFVLYARVSARACIGKSFFKVCKSISVGISMPYRTTLYLN